ncbi:cytochrome c [uncultured Amaricoccus sp.]|uniref:c-type cytochrome n=1 Tax=uncultured Amaricoccus sp. TaxID=339341 RepID=UPI00261AD1B8|nr:cytochrome c [uncultured Amaricoccus sp.]
MRRGQALVMSQCMVCHPVDGGGDAAALRSWRGMQMPGFPPDVLSDADIDAIVAYLGYLAERPK